MISQSPGLPRRFSFLAIVILFLICSNGRATAILGCGQGGQVVKRLVGMFLVVAGLLGTAFADTLSPRAFTEEIAKAVRSAVPSAMVWIERELAVEIQYANGQNVTAEL